MKVVTWEREFNYSAINNFGVKYASGDYFLFLNNDTDRPNTIQEMLGNCQRENGGQMAPLPGRHHPARRRGGGLRRHRRTHLHRSPQVGRLSPGHVRPGLQRRHRRLPLGRCLRRRETPRSWLWRSTTSTTQMKVRAGQAGGVQSLRLYYHYESESRGLEDTPEKIARFNREIKIFSEKSQIKNGDPYYNAI